jgi:hypothetical protein
MTTEPKTEHVKEVENPIRLKDKICVKHHIDQECEYYGMCELKVLQGRYARYNGTYLVCLDTLDSAVVVFRVLNEDKETLDENKLYIYKVMGDKLYVVEFNAIDLVDAIEQSKVAIRYTRREYVEEWIRPILEKTELRNMELTLDDIIPQ